MRRILVVDDETLVADTLGLIFRRHGYEAKVAYSADDALVLVLTGHTSNVARVGEQAGKLRRLARVLTKPCHPEVLLREAGQMLAGG
jgi:hypothetical protein